MTTPRVPGERDRTSSTVIVIANAETEIAIVNGSRSCQTKTFDSQKQINPTVQEVELKYLPLCVLIRLSRTKAKQPLGLEKGVISIVPLDKKCNLPASHSGKQVTRRQFPIMSACAFTIYWSQGQIIPCVILGIAQPVTSLITHFNAYVAGVQA